MPDIRSFFGSKGSQGAPSSQEKTPKAASKPDIKPKGRGKRKVVSDSEDDDEPLPKKSTPQKTATKKPVKQESPKGEATTTSDYFGTKNKPSRTTAVSSRQAPKKEKSPVKKASTPKKPEPAKATPKATPKSAAKSASTSARSQRTSTRKATQKSYAEHDGDEDEVPLVKKDDDSGEDIFGADYKRGSKKMNDDYESDEDDNDAVLAVSKKNANGRKRKSAELSDEEDDEPPKKVNGSKASTKKAAAPKKPRSPAKKKGPEPEDQEMQDIFDSIPQVRPPTPPAPDETKKFNYAQHAARSQPAPQAGSKEIPEGAENCLAGLTFVFTGLQQTLGREEGQELVKRYGGKVTITPSSKTDYVVIGANAGPTKLATIAKLKIKTIDEDGLFALISKLPAHGGSGKNAAKAEEKRQAMEKKIEEEAEKMDRELKKAEAQKAQTQKAQQNASGKAPARVPKVDDELWTTKYAPSSTSQICGNKTQVEKLQNWLRNWKKSAASNFKKGGPDGSGLYRAVMLYGGPGIGKTTAAHLVAKIEGYDIVESNASDTRSKKLVETGLKGILDTTSLLGYFSGDGKQIEAAKKNLVLIMDEVDGMSAGDRGGVGAMAAVCRKTNIPIICICNDRKLPKMKPFDHVTFDLPFRKPTTDQIRSRIMTILFREGMKDMVPPTVVNALIEGSNADIRRIINMISTAKVDSQSMDFQECKKMVGAWEKHVILKPWDITQKILGGHMFGPSSKHTLNEKTELYFNDHEFSSLMLQENYLSTNPVLSLNYSGKEKTLKLLELADRAAESISDGDLCDKMIHGSQQQWSLMPAHAIFSFVRPASFMYGSTAGAGGGVRFTSWLGNNSKQGKLSRFVKDIQAHMRLRAAADRHEIRQQYLPVLWQRIVKGLELHGDENEGVDEIINLMDSYFLTKDDWDAIYELGIGPQSVERVSLSTTTKTRFTKRYNQMSHPLPFMKASGQVQPMKNGKDKPDLEEAIEESDEDELVPEVEAESEEELDLKKDKYVQAPKKKKAPAKKGKKGKAAKDEEDEEEIEVDSDEDMKSKKGRGKPVGSKGKGKGKK